MCMKYNNHNQFEFDTGNIADSQGNMIRKSKYSMIMVNMTLLLMMLAIGAGFVFLPADATESGMDYFAQDTAPTVKNNLEYVGSQSCLECHEKESREWHGSDHDNAMDHATPDTVLANFDDQYFIYNGITSHMYTEGDKFYIATDGADGKIATFEIKYTLGVRPLQQYMVEFADGRIQTLTIAWNTVLNEWFHLYPNQNIDYKDELHWTKPAFTWNFMCAECHTTNLQKNYDQATNTYNTTYSEIDVGCEACHGPGSLHNKLAESTAEINDWDGDVEKKGLKVKFQRSDVSNQKEVDVCARCHSRRMTIQGGFVPGDQFLDYFSPELLEPDLYYADGQILDEVFVYGSFMQARMHRNQVHCTDCHNPHTIKPKFIGNGLCTQCHEVSVYDSVFHHHHEPNTKASLCVECHMPETTYMVVDPRRDHSIRIPRPDFTVKFNIPNACNGCHEHKDETAQWAADKIIEWYGTVRPNNNDSHYVYGIIAGREGKLEGLQLLSDLIKNNDVGPIVRATAASLLVNYYDPEVYDSVAAAMNDGNPMVRASAIRSLEYAGNEKLLELLIPALDDPYKLVRIEAARMLVRLPADSFSEEQNAKLAIVVKEYEQAQLTNADHPAAHLNLGILYSYLGRFDDAIAAYNQAITLAPDYFPARHNLAMLYYQMGDLETSEKIFREIIELFPDQVDAKYYLALLLNEIPDRLDEAMVLFDQAVELDSQRADILYSRGLLHQHLGNIAQAEKDLVAACALEPEYVPYLYAATRLYFRQQIWDKAEIYVKQLIKLEPENQQWGILMDQLEKMKK